MIPRLPVVIGGLSFLVCSIGYVSLALLTHANVSFHQKYNAEVGADTTQAAEVAPGQSVGQTINLTPPSKLGGIAIRYLSVRSAETIRLRATLQQNDIVLQELTGSLPEFNIPPREAFQSQDSTTKNLAYLPWLFFQFDKLPPSTKDYVFTLEALASNTASLPIPFEIDSLSYPHGERRENNQPEAGDLSFALFVSPSFEERLTSLLTTEPHLIVLFLLLATSLCIGLAVQIGQRAQKGMSLLPRQPLLLWLLLATTFTLPLFYDTHHWGNEDWPEVVTHFAAARHSLAAGQFPLWNPYFCGGFPAWANPQTYWPSLTFLISLITNDVIGTKLAVPIYVLIGLAGMTRLGRTLGLRYPATLIAPVMYMLGGFFAFHVSAGHLLWLTMAWVPWLLHFFWKSIHNSGTKNTTLAALFYLLILLEGQIYFLAYVTFFLIGLSILALAISPGGQRRRVGMRTVLFFVLAAALGAIKLLPTWEFVRIFEGTLENIQPLSLQQLPQALFAEPVDIGYQTVPQPWWEMLVYIGYGAFAAAVIGIANFSRGARRIRLFFLISAVLALGLVLLPLDRNPLEWLPAVSHLRSHNRVLLIFVLSLSVLAGFGFQALRRVFPRRAYEAVVLIGVLLLFFDFARVAHSPFANSFQTQPLHSDSAPIFAMRSSEKDTAYHMVAAGVGAPQYCPPHLRAWSPMAAILTESEPEYRGEVYSENATPVALQSFSPNRLKVQIGPVPAPGDTIHINQKYADGWRMSDRPIEPREGHLSFQVKPEDSNTAFTPFYLPFSFAIGAIISGATLILLLILKVHGTRRRAREAQVHS